MPKILFVEDDSFIADIYTKKFEASGFEVTNAATGKAVLKEAKEQVFDLILLDLVIPEMSGTDVLRELRKNHEYSPDLKIVIFSNLSSAEDREETIKLGANGFISKTDFTPTEVVEEVQRFLRQFSEQGKNQMRRNGQGNEGVEKKPRKKILFIENEPVFIEMFGKRLTDEGYEVTIETDGKKALKTALEGNFDFIVSDVMIPSMDGREVVEAVKKNAKTKNVPIFLLTASIEDVDMQKMTDSGFVERAFLKTQTTPSQLAEAVTEYFETHA